MLNATFELLTVYFLSFSVETVRSGTVCECQDLSIIIIRETVTLLKLCCNIIQCHARRKDKKAITVHVYLPWFQAYSFFQNLLALAGTDVFQHLRLGKMQTIRACCPGAKG